METRIVPCDQTCNHSEEIALNHLKSNLEKLPGNDLCILLSNLTFYQPGMDHPVEIDIVALCPFGFYVIEVKHWDKKYILEEEDLFTRHSNLVQKKSKIIGTRLRKMHPDLQFCMPLMLTTRNESSKDAKMYELNGQSIISIDGLPDFGRNMKTIYSTNLITSSARSLNHRSNVVLRNPVHKLGNFVNLYPVGNVKNSARIVYKAQNKKNNSPVILYLYDFTNDSSPNFREVAERESNVILRLQKFDWVPSIVDTYQDVSGWEGELKLFSIIDPNQPTLEKRSKDVNWHFEHRLKFAENCLNALRDFHADPHSDKLVHRKLSPRCIYVKSDNTPILSGFDFTRVPTDKSISADIQLNEYEKQFAAPEVVNKGLLYASQSSDVFSISKCLIPLFENQKDPRASKAIDILSKSVVEDQSKRAELSFLISELTSLIELPTQKSITALDQTAVAPSCWTEGQSVLFNNHHYKIIRELGTGGIGTTFLVEEFNEKSGETFGSFVAKVINSKADGEKVLEAYKRARPVIGREKRLSSIHELENEWQPNHINVLLTWIDGEPLNKWIGYFSSFVTSFSIQEVEEFVFSWVKDICSALDVLHKASMIHGDISPKNIILDHDDGDKPVLTDYDHVTRMTEVFENIGAPLYSAYHPEEARVSAADDIFALGASIFHVVYDADPFPFNNGIDKSKGVQWADSLDELYPNISVFINKATHPNPTERFQSCTEVFQFINSVLPPITAKEQLSSVSSSTEQVIELTDEECIEETSDVFVENSWLKNLLESYPGSEFGNNETRGLDTDFAKDTYIQTNLEKQILKEIESGDIKLTILCGNAGDGKTALLQHLAKVLKIKESKSYERIIQDVLPNGTKVFMNLDGSASFQDKSSDELLNQFFEPFRNGLPKDKIAYFLAINDGRLYEWLENQVPSEFVNDITDLLEGKENTTYEYIRFVNLNQRSLVGGITEDSSDIQTEFLHQLVDRLYGGDAAVEKWNSCKSCRARKVCDIVQTMQVFGPDCLINPEHKEKRNWARQRLFDALQAVHLQGDTHITIRELRAALVYILFGTKYCHDYQNDTVFSHLRYWERVFDSKSANRQGDLLGDIVRFDPGVDTNAKIDSYLMTSSNEKEAVPSYPSLDLPNARRRAYFEWTDNDINRVLGVEVKDDFGLYTGTHLDLYKKIPIFENHDPAQLRKICKDICRGISKLESLPEDIVDRTNIALKVIPRTPTETRFWVEKSPDKFKLEAELHSFTEGIDVLHRNLYLYYSYDNPKSKPEKLRINYNLFHILLEISQGYQLGDISSDDTFSNLSIFVKRLIRENARELYAWNPREDTTIFKIFAKQEYDNNTPKQILALERVEEV